jgi:DNA-binding GntR family transcriptional regulator
MALEGPATVIDQNLRQQVLERVRAEIISGQSAPGTMYSVPSLALSLGVSTTPVREALLELSRIGLIEPLRNRGFRVLEPSVTHLEELFDMRDVLEIHAAVLLTQQPKRDLSALRPHADAIARAVETEDVQAYVEADRAFHFVLIDAAGNSLLTETIMGLRDKMRLYGIGSRAGRERQEASVAEHYRLIDLAETGSAADLTAALRPHIMSWKPIFLEALARSRDRVREPIGGFQARE